MTGISRLVKYLTNFLKYLLKIFVKRDTITIGRKFCKIIKIHYGGLSNE